MSYCLCVSLIGVLSWPEREGGGGGRDSHMCSGYIMYALQNMEEIWSAQSLNRLSLIGFVILRYRLCLMTRDECGTSGYIMSTVTHTMVKGLSRCKFAAVNFYSGLLFQGDLRLYVILFTSVEFRFHAIIFRGNTWRTFTASGIFGFIKTVDIEDKRKKTGSPCCISEISESSEQASEFAFQKNTNVCSNYRACKQMISSVFLKTILK